MVGAWGNEDLIENAFAMREYDPGDELTAGPLRIRFQPVPHFVDSNAVEIASTNGGGRITYGADHAPTEHIVEFARDTDLLVIEATLPRPEREGPRGHITPGEAGEHARKRRRAPRPADPLLRRAGRGLGPRGRGEGVRRRRSRWPARARSYDV